MLFNFGVLVLAATLSNAASLPRPSNVASGPGYISLPVIAVNTTDSAALNRKRQSTELFNPDSGTVYLVHRMRPYLNI